MDMRKLFLFLLFLAAIFIPWYKRYIPHFFAKNICDESESLIDIGQLKNISNMNICNYQDLKNLIKILSQYDKNLEFIHLLAPDRQFETYKNLIEDYIIDAYAVEKYLQDKNIVREADFMKEKKLYLKIMENNFNVNFFKKYLSENLKVEDVFAEDYYNRNKLKEFTKHPFVKQAPSIQARVIKMNKGEVPNKLYENALLQGTKDCIKLDNYNPYNNADILSSSLLAMKNKEFFVITLENNQKFMLYKINELQPEWYEYKDISSNVKAYLQEKLVNDEASRIISQIKADYNIKVCDKNLTEYIKASNASQMDELANLDECDDDLLVSEAVKNVSQEVVV
jgi:hypothetical protein